MSSPVPTPAATLAEGLSYPVHLDLRGRRVLVVGAGSVAARKVERLVPAGARSGEMMWAPNSLSSNPERLWRRRTMDTNARKKVRTRRRSNRASSYPPNGPMNNSNRSATCCPCRRPASCCNIRKPPLWFGVWTLPLHQKGASYFSRFPNRFPRFLNSGMTHVFLFGVPSCNTRS